MLIAFAGKGRADFFIHHIENNGRFTRYIESTPLTSRFYGINWYDYQSFWENSNGHAIAPDLKTIYFLLNSVGRTGLAAIDLASGDIVPGIPFQISPFSQSPESVSIFGGSALRFDQNTQTLLMGALNGPSSSSSSVVAFNSTTGAYRGSGDLPPAAGQVSHLIVDPNLSTLGQHPILAATPNGIYRSEGFFSSRTPTFIWQFSRIIPEVSGDIAIGPDGLLYVGERASGKINRYNATTGAFIDTFLTAADVASTDFTSIEFSQGGALYVYSANRVVPMGWVTKLNPWTREVLRSYRLSPAGSQLLTLIPEPAATSLALIAVVGGLSLSRRPRTRVG